MALLGNCFLITSFHWEWLCWETVPKRSGGIAQGERCNVKVTNPSEGNGLCVLGSGDCGGREEEEGGAPGKNPFELGIKNWY